MRLIDADRLLETLNQGAFSSIRKVISREPTIDAEPVVRCKHCKYFLKLNSERMCGKKLTTVNEDYYCSNGTKRDEEAEQG